MHEFNAVRRVLRRKLAAAHVPPAVALETVKQAALKAAAGTETSVDRLLRVALEHATHQSIARLAVMSHTWLL